MHLSEKKIISILYHGNIIRPSGLLFCQSICMLMLAKQALPFFSPFFSSRDTCTHTSGEASIWTVLQDKLEILDICIIIATLEYGGVSHDLAFFNVSQ